ncbi:nuclear transport factor 2 family protein [Haloterrigena salifodinae]|uniref:nuclear transport factor 2 family protein n=1 Tax=Haloterrigena salifodinae TaxID=2675099 RepID=UPI000F85B9DA|nr:nuclear transport factor 2 family protein [Haloterrigena salifodinae]
MSDGDADRAEAVVRDYYDALRSGDPLEPYFLEDESTVKFGISEALFGFESVREALEEQTATTADWTVESGHLVVSERDAFATFADEVTMAWTDTENGANRRFETRWSGTLVRDGSSEQDTDAAGAEAEPSWRFATMHVSTADEL